MKNLTIGKKLIVGFGTVLVLMLVSIGAALFSIDDMGTQTGYYYTYTVPNMESVGKIEVDILETLSDMQKAVLSDDPQVIQKEFDLAAANGKAVVDNLNDYANTQRNHDRDAEIEKLRTLLTAAASSRAEITELLKDPTEENHGKALKIYEENYSTKLNQAMDVLKDLSASSEKRSVQQKAESEAAKNRAWVLLFACAAVSVTLTIVVIIAIRRSILNPIKEIVEVYTQVSKGNKQVNVTYDGKDELGQMASLIRKTNEQEGRIIGDVIHQFTKISQGDLDIQIEQEYPGDFIAIKQAIENTAATLNQAMRIINTAAEQVATGSEQVSSGAQALASGSTEQASSVEELNAAVVQVAEQASENLSAIQVAAGYIEQAGAGVFTSNEYMSQLSEAMTEISTSSAQIANITKAIEDIAFQTNILALNAAIEAARAGNAGKGFAVVADEVRNLAAKSAEAAHQTGELIEAAVATVKKGTQITGQTAQALQDAGVNTQKVTESFSKIERASTAQTEAIEQIKEGLNQISAVVQTNAATAEENSATSEEMATQAAILRREIEKFKLDMGGEQSMDISSVCS